MVETTTSGPGFAHLMLGIPRTPNGTPMRGRPWYQLTPPLPVRDGVVAPYVAVGNDGVYECDSTGNVNFTRRVHTWPIGSRPADVLAGVGDGYVGIS